MPDSPPALRPCPWCGSSPRKTGSIIWCEGEGDDRHDYVEQHIGRWNRRALATFVPDPDNERQRDAVADAMKQTCFASSWDEQARAVLTALRDMT